MTWRLVMGAAALVVAFDHRKAIIDLDIGLSTVLQRWRAYSHLAEALVVSDRPKKCAEQAFGNASSAST